MKAIQIKYLPFTNHRGSRLKAFTEAGSLIESRDGEDISTQARNLAEKYIAKMNWNECQVSGFGKLPNGDYVATIKGK